MSTTQLPTARPGSLLIAGIDTEEGPSDSFLVDEDKPRFKLDPTMTASIITHGVIDPVTVRSIDGKLYIVKGRRRILHAREAEKRAKKNIDVPYILQDGGDTQDAKVEDIISNSFRVGHSVMAQARKAKHLLSVGEDEGRVAAMLGISKSTLVNRLKMLDLAPKVQKMVEEGKVAPMGALELVKLPADEQVDAAEKMVAGSKTGSRKETGTKAAKRATRGASEEPEGFSKGFIKKLLATEKASELDPMVVKVLKVVAGEIAYSSVAGLAACVNEIEAAAAERAEKAKEREKKAKKGGKKAPPRTAA